MIELNIPGRGAIQIQHLVCDVNGTLALDGQLQDRLARIFATLHDRLRLPLLTANTHGQQEIIDRQLSMKATRIQRGDESAQKAAYVEELGADRVAAIGQGANDAEMLRSAALGIGILSREGMATQTLIAADLIVPDIYAALELFAKPLRIVATLRQ